MLTDYCNVKYDKLMFIELLYTCELKEKEDNFDTVNVTGQPTVKSKKTLTTEKTSLIIILIAITDICRI